MPIENATYYFDLIQHLTGVRVGNTINFAVADPETGNVNVETMHNYKKEYNLLDVINKFHKMLSTQSIQLHTGVLENADVYLVAVPNSRSNAIICAHDEFHYLRRKIAMVHLNVYGKICHITQQDLNKLTKRQVKFADPYIKDKIIKPLLFKEII